VGAPAPFQKAGVYALGMGDAYYAALKLRYQTARDRVCSALNAAGFTVHPPKGAYYIMAQSWPLMKQLKETTAYQFCLKLIDETGIATVPGTAFYHSRDMGHDYVRFCFAKNEKTLDDICERLQGL
jgi:aminotransferase